MNLTKTIEEILKKPYTWQIVPEEDGSFFGQILEFPGCISLKDTKEEAITSLEEVAKSWLEIVIRNGQSIPHPFNSDKERFKEALEFYANLTFPGYGSQPGGPYLDSPHEIANRVLKDGLTIQEALKKHTEEHDVR